MGDKLSNNIPQLNVSPESYLNDFQNPINQFTCFREIKESEVLSSRIRCYKSIRNRRNFGENFGNYNSSNCSMNCIKF